MKTTGGLKKSSRRAFPRIDGRRVLILGDSVTEAGTYVSFILHLLHRSHPDWNLSKIVSAGLASETLSGLSEKEHPFPRPCLFERLQRALEKFKPEILVACYGMNDGIYHPQSPERFKAFQDGVLRLAREAKAAGVKSLVLMTPPPFDPEPIAAQLRGDGAETYSYLGPHRRYASVLEDYSRWLMELRLPDGHVLDLNTPMTLRLKAKRKADPSFRFSSDGIHPDSLGHLLMAAQLLRDLEVDTGKDGLEKLLERIEADPLFKLVDERRKTLSEAWLAYIGYTRERPVRLASIDEALAKAGELQRRIDAELRQASLPC